MCFYLNSLQNQGRRACLKGQIYGRDVQWVAAPIYNIDDRLIVDCYTADLRELSCFVWERIEWKTTIAGRRIPTGVEPKVNNDAAAADDDDDDTATST